MEARNLADGPALEADQALHPVAAEDDQAAADAATGVTIPADSPPSALDLLPVPDASSIIEADDDNAIEPIEAIADWEAAYLVRLDSGQLRTVLESLLRPLDTRARELRTRALEAYRNGWFDDAYRDLQGSVELNRYDFTIHQVLGNIAFAHLEDLDEATAHYANAAKYAQPKSPLDAAYAHVSLAAIAEARGNMIAAVEHARDAMRACDDCPEASYSLAKYLVATGAADDEVTRHLMGSFWGKPSLSSAALSDSILSSRADLVCATIERYRERLRKLTLERVDILAEGARVLAQAASTYPDASVVALSAEVTSLVEHLRTLLMSVSVLDVREALRRSRREARDLIRRGVVRTSTLAEEIRAEDAGSRARAEAVADRIERGRTAFTLATTLGFAAVFAIGWLVMLVGLEMYDAAIGMLCASPFAVMLTAMLSVWSSRNRAARARADFVERPELRGRFDRLADDLVDVLSRLDEAVDDRARAPLQLGASEVQETAP